MKFNTYFSGLKLAALLLVAFFLSSCEGLLNKVPVTELVEEIGIRTEADIVALTNSAYDATQWQVIEGAQTHMFPVMFQDIRADNCISQWASFWTFGLPFDDFSQILPNNSNIAAMWRKWFTAVARANTAMAFISTFEGFETPGLQDRLMAEAKFVRGFAYFELVKHFGQVPLITTNINSTSDELAIPRASVADIYAQIERDFFEASEVLPDSYTGGDLGRATSGAALAFLAKAHLYQQEYDEARTYTEQIISSGNYQLEEDYAANWSLDNEYGKESIFEIGYQDGFTNFYFEAPGGNTNQGSASYQMFGYIFAQTGTFGNSVPRQELIDLYAAEDTRRDATFITPDNTYEGRDNSCGCAVLPDCTGDFSTEGNWLPNSTDTYNYFWTNSDALCSRASMRKYDIPSSLAVNLLQLSSTPLNEKVIRYADVLLMHAEASLQAGGDGLSSINAVRTRAGLEALGSYTLDDVKLERRKELATEGWDRFTDLVRWGDAASALAFKGFQAGRDELLPIPQSEIDLVGSDVLTQNPGY
ncbi:MAG: RagB/SusD family nutrient uptake outer membrane protein [Bacteroidia bacterium]|nr:RagB/SusD family nutrient uptake outer membrane protein [Bacteroidia bacterium]